MSDFTPTVILDTPIVLGTSQGTQEVQKVDFSVQEAAKTSTLELDGAKTAAIKQKSEVTAAEVLAALTALPNVGPVGSGQEFEVVGVTGTGGVLTITFVGKDGNVPTLVATSTGSPAPTVSTVTQGEAPAEAVAKGFGQADATGREQPRAGKSPKTVRAEHASEFGD
jgi:hypothetical protein